MEHAMKNLHALPISEGLARSASTVIQKFVGLTGETLSVSAAASCIIGAVQMFAGIVGAASARGTLLKRLFPDARAVLWSIATGALIGVFGSVLTIYTMTLGADIGIRTLLVNLYVIPAALGGAILWKDALGVRQWVSIALTLLAAWAMLDFPLDLAFDTWVWLTLLIALAMAVVELLSRAAALRSIEAWAHNFWIGVPTLVVSLGTLAMFPLELLQISGAFIAGSLALGGLVICMISFRFLAFKAGSTIAYRNIIMQGTFFVSAVVAGIVIFGEPATIGKFLGIVLWMSAVILMKK
ncbi:MAG: hypothetical protein UY63_C0016G0010 [Parcubacteria group bacterium GW2011_GWA2_51_10]|nr:MAG: hypothetical protein UY63_C0016G0010 [Parcubacteria group bacterium GW2011_GWA2_51_10]